MDEIQRIMYMLYHQNYNVSWRHFSAVRIGDVRSCAMSLPGIRNEEVPSTHFPLSTSKKLPPDFAGSIYFANRVWILEKKIPTTKQFSANASRIPRQLKSGFLLVAVGFFDNQN